MAESLSDRHFESYRRIRPGQVVKNRLDDASHREEYALAVVTPDGDPIALTTDDLLLELLIETRAVRIGIERLLGLHDDGNTAELIEAATAETDGD